MLMLIYTFIFMLSTLSIISHFFIHITTKEFHINWIMHTGINTHVCSICCNWNQFLFTGGAYTKKVILITILIRVRKMAMQLAWLA